MFIESLEVEYPKTGWQLLKTQFQQLNLLVGASGVGKTRILEAILDLSEIASNSDILVQRNLSEGIQWKIEFRLPNSLGNYSWEGEIVEISIDEKTEVYFKKEVLSHDLQAIFSRKGNEIWFKSKLTPKLSASNSGIFLLREEAEIASIYAGFKSIVISEEIHFSDGIYELPNKLNQFKDI